MNVLPIRKPLADRCPTCHRRHQRSHPQNARYWLLMYRLSDELKPDGVTYSADVWHHYCAGRFLGNDEFILPDKRISLTPKRTSALDVDQFSTYFDAVQAWANERNVWLDE